MEKILQKEDKRKEMNKGGAQKIIPESGQREGDEAVDGDFRG